MNKPKARQLFYDLLTFTLTIGFVLLILSLPFLTTDTSLCPIYYIICGTTIVTGAGTFYLSRGN